MALPRFLQPHRGSVLVFSLMVLAILLSTAITVATVSATNKRTVLDTLQSNRTFQIATSGIELTLEQIYKENASSLSALASGMGGGSATCADSVITKTDLLGGTARLSFFDNNGAQISCTDSNWRSKVVRLKSEGNLASTTRVIETAVASGSNFGWVQIEAGGTFQAGSGWDSYYNYPSGARTPNQMCVSAGFLYATGACRTVTTRQATTFIVTGSIMSGIETSTRGFIACLYWNGNSYFDGDAAGNEILCAK